MTLVFSGLALGAIYALVAIGYNLVYVASHAFNFAQAHLIMVGAFVAYTGHVTFRLPAVLVVPLAMAAVAVLAAVEERIAVRPVADHQTQLITTLGFGTVLTGVASVVWGTQPREVPFVAPNTVLTVLGGRIYLAEAALIVLAVVLVALIAWYGRTARGGLALRAMSEDGEAASLRGVDVRRFAFGAFAVTGALAGLMGVFVGPKTFAVATLGAALALKGFVALAIGGFGSFGGGLAGGFAVGLVETFAARYLGASFSTLSVFVLLLVMLLIRPAGLFGRVQERVV